MAELRAAAEQRGYKVTLEVAETGSGARSDRPGLQRTLDAARKGKVSAVIVTRLDRFGRSSLDLLANIRALTDAGVRFTCTEQAIDIKPGGDPMGQLVLTILAGVAEFERTIIRDRVREGQRRAIARGVKMGRPMDEKAPDPKKVQASRARGYSWAEVARTFNCTVSAARRAAGR
jgi:DNA invertase Pin-like site-specific DNA recombinase